MVVSCQPDSRGSTGFFVEPGSGRQQRRTLASRTGKTQKGEEQPYGKTYSVTLVGCAALRPQLLLTALGGAAQHNKDSPSGASAIPTLSARPLVVQLSRTFDLTAERSKRSRAGTSAASGDGNNSSPPRESRGGGSSSSTMSPTVGPPPLLRALRPLLSRVGGGSGAPPEPPARVEFFVVTDSFLEDLPQLDPVSAAGHAFLFLYDPEDPSTAEQLRGRLLEVRSLPPERRPLQLLVGWRRSRKQGDQLLQESSPSSGHAPPPPGIVAEPNAMDEDSMSSSPSGSDSELSAAKAPEGHTYVERFGLDGWREVTRSAQSVEQLMLDVVLELDRRVEETTEGSALGSGTTGSPGCAPPRSFAGLLPGALMRSGRKSAPAAAVPPEAAATAARRRLGGTVDGSDGGSCFTLPTTPGIRSCFMRSPFQADDSNDEWVHGRSPLLPVPEPKDHNDHTVPPPVDSLLLESLEPLA